MTVPSYAEVSVVIPCFRCVETIERAVLSVAKQTLRPAEVILVDDCSNDGTFELLQRIQRCYTKGWIKIIVQQINQGPASARNAGWKMAKQPYIAFLDADDAWHPQSVSYAYLTEVLGLNNVSQMADPAFALKVQPVDRTEFWPENTNGVVGLNVSPLIERYKKSDQNLVAETAHFIRRTVIEKGHGILLIPHVIPLNGSEKNNDAVYMTNIFKQCGDLGERVKMAPATLNAAQLKYAIGQLRFFIGARTHATIAALSSGVPTVSIAYSIKARGINRDLFGDESMVVPTPELNSGRMVAALDYLANNEKKLRGKLALVLPDYQNRICQAMQGIKAEIV